VKRITAGENAIIRRNLEKADGTALLLSSLTSLTAEIMQNGVVIESLTYPAAKLRQGATTSQIELEINTTVSVRFKKGRVSVRWTIVASSAVFTAEGSQKNIKSQDVLDVV
jgi:hypothetical protein